jgi:XTP/dITP diphosphohydrolase
MYETKQGGLMSTIFIATNNPGKQKEFAALLKSCGREVMFPQALADYEEPAEPAETFLENALIKARYGAKVSGLPCVSDDSGLCVPALHGAPGVHSAYYSGQKDNLANNQKLMTAIKKVPEAERQGFYCCVLVLVQDEHDPMPIVFQGLWYGVILPEARGSEGFGYDPLFYIPSLQKTAAELTSADKNKLSHRALALNKLLTFLHSRPA